MRWRVAAMAFGCIFAVALACKDDAPSREALAAEYNQNVDSVSATPFSASYRLTGEGEAAHREGTLRWRFDASRGQRFDIEITEPPEHRSQYTLIETRDGRTICTDDRRSCSDNITELQGSDFLAIALGLPVGAAWTFEEPADVDLSSFTRVDAESDTRGRCFRFIVDDPDDLTLEVEECFKDGRLALRRWSGEIDAEGESLTIATQWTLVDESDLTAGDSFLAPPYEIRQTPN